ncbi:MAG: hypothetical protein QW684_07160 [Candidatus Nitrosocaldus sp.]
MCRRDAYIVARARACNSSNSTSSKIMLAIQCPRCGKVYHGMIDGSGSTCNGRESSNDLHCYS